MTKFSRSFACSLALVLLLSGAAAAQAPAPVRPQAPVESTSRPPAYHAVTYDVRASILPAEQALTGQAIVEFESRGPSTSLECELHPNLRITAVRDAAGKAVEFERDFGNQLIVRVTLPAALPAGQRVKLTFDYTGQLPNEQNSSPVPGTRVAWVGAQGAYLLLPGRWFPLTEFPSNRYTGTFRIDVPEGFVVAGTGTPEGIAAAPPMPSATVADPSIPVLNRRNQNPNVPPPPAPAATPAPPSSPRTMYTFRVDRPQAAGTFVVGALQRSAVQAEGLNISVYTPAAASGGAQAYGEAAARIVNTFSAQFGSLPQPNITVAQIPDGTVTGYAAPGLLLVSARHWGAQPDSRLLSNLAASQWWGDQVMAASPSDVWLTDGLARYSEALYVEQTANREAMNHALEDFAVGALMYEDAAPIAEANRLSPLTSQYLSVVVNKGAMVFHMLRARLGDAPFAALLRDFYTQYSGKQVSVADFERLADSRLAGAAPPSTEGFAIRVNAAPVDAPTLRPFFAQWLNSTGVPEFTVDYTVFRTPKGFRVVGKIKQPLDVFRADLELQIVTEGNPEIKMVTVSGTESDFDVEVFGRPKAGGVTLDPHDYILKSSPRLRVRAIIARGEALAEQSRFYDAIQQYAQALDIQKNQALAQFRMGEVFFYQKNYQASANSFRGALDGDIDPADKWVEVWAHIYLGKIFDISGDRTRAVNEYSRAQQTNDDTGGAQEEVKKYIAAPYSDRPA